MFGNSAGTFGRYYSSGSKTENYFCVCQSPQGSVLGCFHSKKNLFLASFPLPGAMLRYLETHFAVYSSISWKLLHIILSNFCTDVFYITLTIRVLKKTSQHVSLCWKGYIVQYFSMSSNHKAYSWYFARKSWYYSGGHLTEKCAGTLRGVFGLFCSMFLK